MTALKTALHLGDMVKSRRARDTREEKIFEKTELFIAFDAILAEGDGSGGKSGFKDNSCVGFGEF